MIASARPTGGARRRRRRRAAPAFRRGRAGCSCTSTSGRTCARRCPGRGTSGCRPVEDALAGGHVDAAHPAGEHRLARRPTRCRSSSAVCVGSVIACGVRMTSRPSLFGSAAAISSAFAYRSGSASSSTSIGLPWLQCGGSSASSGRPSPAATARSSSPPLAISASVASTPGAAGVGDDGQARAARPRLLAEHLGHVEQLGDRVDAQHAAPPEGGVEHLVAAGQRAGVRGGRPGGGRRCGPP